jgi:hypothetical protein
MAQGFIYYENLISNIYLFYGLIKDVGSSYYITGCRILGWVIQNELESIWKEAVGA